MRLQVSRGGGQADDFEDPLKFFFLQRTVGERTNRPASLYNLH
jgi:hypothetical protein